MAELVDLALTAVGAGALAFLIVFLATVKIVDWLGAFADEGLGVLWLGTMLGAAGACFAIALVVGLSP